MHLFLRMVVFIARALRLWYVNLCMLWCMWHMWECLRCRIAQALMGGGNLDWGTGRWCILTALWSKRVSLVWLVFVAMVHVGIWTHFVYGSVIHVLGDMILVFLAMMILSMLFSDYVCISVLLRCQCRRVLHNTIRSNLSLH